MIGGAREENGSYYFEEEIMLDEQAQVVINSYTQSSEYEILLSHFMLGNLSLLYLKQLSPSLFHNKHLPNLKCEFCEFEKRHRAHFLPNLYKESAPFTLIHSNIWGTSLVTNIFVLDG